MLKKNKRMMTILISMALIALFLPAAAGFGVTGSDENPGVRVIVVFEEGVTSSSLQGKELRSLGAYQVKNLEIINGASAVVPQNIIADLSRSSIVRSVEKDVRVHASAQVLPWGIDRIDAEQVWSQTTADNVKVAVIDTGISAKHPDLLANLKGGYSAVAYTSRTNDDNGHGTHVGGTIAALNNDAGVVGVGPNIDLYAVKVLDRRGSGYLSDVIEGIDWAAANDMDVINMSLGTSSDLLAMRIAVANAHNSGVTIVSAAGNSGGSVGYPAAYDEAIAVSATDSSNNLASFSSRGTQVDIAAPGVGIYSTYKGVGYATLNGTSMASPHVAGTAALIISTPISVLYDVNANNVWDPAEVKAKLQATATDLGTVGPDNNYGAGLVNALAATQ